mgnify:CR=1 FL=1
MPSAGNAKNPLTAPCPQCKRPARLDADNPWRPFCCERCKLLDLGEWFSERHTIPGADDITVDQDDETLQ